MRSHVFVVNERTFPTCRNRRVCATGVRGIPEDYSALVDANIQHPQKQYFSLICDIACTRPGDLVFFYERQEGFHGIYVVDGPPYFDASIIQDIDGSNGQVVDGQWPFRIPIRLEAYFERPVPEERLFTTRDRETCFWTWFYRKLQGARGCNSLDPAATTKLIELLIKENARATKSPPFEPYEPSQPQPMSPPLYAAKDEDPLEDCLRWWIAQNVDSPENTPLRELLGPASHLEWFANNVPFHVTGKNIDFLCYHVNRDGDVPPIRYKYSVIELKRHTANTDDLMQLLGYARWVAGRLAEGETEIVQPILLAKKIPTKVQQYAVAAAFNDLGIRLVEYKVVSDELALEIIG